MGTDVLDAKETPPYLYSFKVHRSMCVEVMKFVQRIESKIPEIEAARPRGPGMEALSLLHDTIGRSKQLLQSCRESSKLYLAIFGDSIVSRCQKYKDLMERNLGLLQTVVRVELRDEIYEIIYDLRKTEFVMDSCEAEARKALRELFHLDISMSDSLERQEIDALKIAASMLDITSADAIRFEKGAIKDLLVKIGDRDLKKKNALKYLYHLLHKYGRIIEQDTTESTNYQFEGSCIGVNPGTTLIESVETDMVVKAPVIDPSNWDFQPLDVSSSSISSFGSSMNFQLPLDISSISLGFSYISFTNSSRTRVPHGSNDVVDLEALSRLDELIRFLRDACEEHDASAQASGLQSLLAFVSKERSPLSYLHEDVIRLLASFFESELAEEALSVFEVLSADQHCRPKITSSGAVLPILKLLDSKSKESQEQAIRILDNLCTDTGSAHEARAAVVETNGSVASIVRLLRSLTQEDQEHALSILLSLCSQSVENCKLVMDQEDTIFQLLYDISNNGSERGKPMASELLRQLTDTKSSTCEDQCLQADINASRDSGLAINEGKSSSKKSRFFRHIFSSAPKKK